MTIRKTILCLLLSFLLFWTTLPVFGQGGPGGETGQGEAGEGERQTSSLETTILNSIPQPEGSAVVLDARTGTLIVRNTPTNIERIDKIVQALDVPPAQVLIEAKFIDIRDLSLHDISIDMDTIRFGAFNELGWKDGEGDLITDQIDIEFGDHLSSEWDNWSAEGLTLDLTKGTALNSSQYRMVLTALLMDSENKVLSSPRLICTNNQEAHIEVITTRILADIESVDETTELVWEYDTADDLPDVRRSFVEDFVEEVEGIFLDVIPHIGADNKTIEVELHPNLIDYLETATNPWGYYQEGFREVETTLVINSGETIVMGGLIREKEIESIAKVPFLGDIPFLGMLFRKREFHTEKRNLVIFVTVTILTPAGKPFEG